MKYREAGMFKDCGCWIADDFDEPIDDFEEVDEEENDESK